MYKSTSRSMNRLWGRDTARPVKEYAPRTRAEHRMWWYKVIVHHFETGTSARMKYGKKMPDWLAEELRRFTYRKWLAYWDENTGQKREAPYVEVGQYDAEAGSDDLNP